MIILTDENRLLGLPNPPMWRRLSLRLDCHVTPFVTVPPAPLLKGRFLELADIGEVGLVSVFTKILPPQAPESVATGMLGGMKVKLLFYQMLNRSRHFYFTVVGVKKHETREQMWVIWKKLFIIFFLLHFKTCGKTLARFGPATLDTAKAKRQLMHTTRTQKQ